MPDLDSKNSKISQKIPIINWIKSDVYFIISLMLALFSAVLYFKADFINKDITMYAIFLSSGLLLLHFLIKILFKHRKFTHCILTCVLFGILSFLPFTTFNNKLTLLIGIGLSIGYTSHIFYDCLTTRGCPLLFPITSHNFSFGKLNSEKDGHKAMFLSYMIITISVLYYIGIFDLIIFMTQK